MTCIKHLMHSNCFDMVNGFWSKDDVCESVPRFNASSSHQNFTSVLRIHRHRKQRAKTKVPPEKEQVFYELRIDRTRCLADSGNDGVSPKLLLSCCKCQSFRLVVRPIPDGRKSLSVKECWLGQRLSDRQSLLYRRVSLVGMIVTTGRLFLLFPRILAQKSGSI